jgi:hypothetical protein
MFVLAVTDLLKKILFVLYYTITAEVSCQIRRFAILFNWNSRRIIRFKGKLEKNNNNNKFKVKVLASTAATILGF